MGDYENIIFDAGIDYEDHVKNYYGELQRVKEGHV